MQEVKLGDGNTIQGDFVIAGSIENSFNKVTASGAAEDIKALLQQVVHESANVIKVLPKDAALEASRDLETLTSEAISKEPRKQWIHLSAEGLVKAAKNVGAVGIPLIEILHKVVPLLTGS